MCDNIRKAETRDIPRIAEILVFGKRTAYRKIFNDDKGSFNELRVTDTAREFENGERRISEVLVYDDGIVRGMLTGVFDESDTAELCELYVEPFFTGSGIGTELADFFITEAKNRDKRRICLWVIKENKRAVRFYEKLSFSADGRERAVEGTAVCEIGYTRLL